MAVDLIPLINGNAYDWASIKLILLGVPIIGITAIEYKEVDEKNNNYGAGRMPVSRSRGNVVTTASITLYKDTIVALQAVAPNGRIQDIPAFDIPVAYINSSGKFTVDVIKNCEFLENGVNTKQNDKNIEVPLPLITSHIAWGK